MIPNTPRIRTSRNKQGSTSRFREVGMTRLPRKVGKVKEMTVASEWDDVLAAPVLREFAQKELQTRQAQLDESCGRIEALQAEILALKGQRIKLESDAPVRSSPPSPPSVPVVAASTSSSSTVEDVCRVLDGIPAPGVDVL